MKKASDKKLHVMRNVVRDLTSSQLADAQGGFINQNLACAATRHAYTAPDRCNYNLSFYRF